MYYFLQVDLELGEKEELLDTTDNKEELHEIKLHEDKVIQDYIYLKMKL